MQDTWNDGVDPKGTNVLGIVSLVTGILGLVMNCCCGWLSIPLGIAAIVTGFMARKDPDPSTQQFGTIGMILGAVDIVLMGVMLVLGVGLQVLAAVLGG